MSEEEEQKDDGSVIMYVGLAVGAAILVGIGVWFYIAYKRSNIKCPDGEKIVDGKCRGCPSPGEWKRDTKNKWRCIAKKGAVLTQDQRVGAREFLEGDFEVHQNDLLVKCLPHRPSKKCWDKNPRKPCAWGTSCIGTEGDSSSSFDFGAANTFSVGEQPVSEQSAKKKADLVMMKTLLADIRNRYKMAINDDAIQNADSRGIPRVIDEVQYRLGPNLQNVCKSRGKFSVSCYKNNKQKPCKQWWGGCKKVPESAPAQSSQLNPSKGQNFHIESPEATQQYIQTLENILRTPGISPEQKFMFESRLRTAEKTNFVPIKDFKFAQEKLEEMRPQLQDDGSNMGIEMQPMGPQVKFAANPEVKEYTKECIEFPDPSKCPDTRCVWNPLERQCDPKFAAA